MFDHRREFACNEISKDVSIQFVLNQKKINFINPNVRELRM